MGELQISRGTIVLNAYILYDIEPIEEKIDNQDNRTLKGTTQQCFLFKAR